MEKAVVCDNPCLVLVAELLGLCPHHVTGLDLHRPPRITCLRTVSLAVDSCTTRFSAAAWTWTLHQPLRIGSLPHACIGTIAAVRVATVKAKDNDQLFSIVG